MYTVEIYLKYFEMNAFVHDKKSKKKFFFSLLFFYLVHKFKLKRFKIFLFLFLISNSFINNIPGKVHKRR